MSDRPHGEDPFIRHLREAGIRPQWPTQPSFPSGPRTRRRIGFVVLLFLAVVLLPALTMRLADWLWFREIGFERVFLTKIAAQWATGAVAGVVAFAVLYGNARLAVRGFDPASIPPHDHIGGLGTLEPRVRAAIERGANALALPWTA
ncbi:MAG: UPF0182 family protein, partial [Gemmatimonadaceae bacterium]|nr:UPF0182 family protein [Gemmatimonadaceae bacterium]